MTLVAAALTLVPVLGACSSGSGDGESASGSTDDVTAEDAAGARDVPGGAVADPGSAAGSSTAGSQSELVVDLDVSAFAGRDVIRTAQVSVVAKDVDSARAEVAVLMTRLGGAIASETTTIGKTRGGGAEAVQTTSLGLQVPTSRFDAAVDGVSDLGRVSDRVIQSQDVTEQVAEVDSRVESARQILQRVRLLLDRANSLGTVIRLEGKLADRQADLEALLAQQRALAGQTELATIQLELTTGQPGGPPTEDDDPRGFTDGLSAGWTWLSGLGVAVSTVVGVLLPFALVVAALSIPLLVWRRRRSDVPVSPPLA